MTAIYKIMTAKDWRDFQLMTVYQGSAVDRKDGYIHFSTEDQLMATLDKHYAGQNGLVVLELESATFAPEVLKWEPARGGDLFPHLYQDLPLSAVRQAVSVGVREDGRFALPEDLIAGG